MSPIYSPGRLLIPLFSLWLTVAHAAPVSNSSFPTVTISSGVVVGTSAASVNAYLGVPFAQSPPERFSPPTPAPAWTSPLQAQVLKPACIQQFMGIGSEQANLKAFFNNPGGSPPEESEDCLYLNVYAPLGASPSTKKSVLVWLFGGNLQFGTGNLDTYNGTVLAKNEDVVVVTFNYRTNIFGFSNSPEVPFGSQNSGFLDQRFALQWVRENIAQFGGDSSKVTIFGESAGGESIKQLLANPPSPLPFAGAILQSENTVLLGNGLDNYNNVSDHFGCTSAASPITCLRAVPAMDIKTYIEVNSINFPPVDGDGTSIADIRQSISAGKFADVPILMGTNLNEVRVFLAVLGLNNGTAAVDAVFDYLGITDPEVQQSLFAAYAAAGVEVSYYVADRLLTDSAFTCTTGGIASYLASFGYDVWRYRYNAAFPTTTLFANSGVYHTSEIPEVFGTYPIANQYGVATTQQIQLSKYMQHTWANFAKGTSPSWPRIGSALGFELGELGLDGSSGEKTNNVWAADYPCAFYAAIDDILQLSW